MQKNHNVELTFSESGRICRILADNGRIIAEILVHGPLSQVTENCINATALIPGRANVFRGELYALPGYEYLNIAEERIEEK